MHSGPSPPLPFSKNGMFPTLWHNLTKEVSWKNIGGLLFRLWNPGPPSWVGMLTETSLPKLLLRFWCLESFERGSDGIMPTALPTVTEWQMSVHVYVHACLYSHQQVWQTGWVTVVLLRRQENRLIYKFPHDTETTVSFGKDWVKVRSVLWLFSQENTFSAEQELLGSCVLLIPRTSKF